jgi:glyoxylase-like metal-dependent hydrolase (beta-lactamase superfamily II)
LTAPAETRIHVLTTGVVRPKAGRRGIRRYLVDEWSAETLPVNAFLVDQGGRRVLFDAGQTARATTPGWFPRWLPPFFRLSRFELQPEDEIEPQLRRLGIEPASVRSVILSHLHTDHVGCLFQLASVEVLVSRLEWERAVGLKGRLRGYVPQHWPAGLVPTLVDFTGPALGPFRGSYDVDGDGTLVLVPTPGHTMGHAALLVRSRTGAWLLAGDMAHTPDEIAQTDPDIFAWCKDERVVILTAHDRQIGDLPQDTRG